MPEITLAFEELPIGSRVVDGRQCSIDVYACGMATIEYDDDGWCVSRIQIMANIMVNSVNRSRYIDIEKNELLWPLIEAAIRNERSEWIDGAIGDDMRERGEWRDPNEEHRLSARQLGIES